MTEAAGGRLGGFLAKRDYRGADMAIVRRVTAVVALLTGLLLAAISPLTPPDESIGYAGWSVLVLLAGGCVLLGLRLRRVPELTPNAALAAHAGGLVVVAVAIWLSGGRQSPYDTLFLIWLALAGASHPPRRVFALVGLVAVLAALPLAYDEAPGVYLADLGLSVAMWSVVAVMACVWTTQVRIQRVHLMEEEETAKRQARADPLTALGNRRAFDERLDREIDLARARGRALSVIVSDLDDFKQINDAYGHLNGDEVLRTAADAMRAAVRDEDTCYRWGGDEFAVLLPGVERDAAERVAERMAASVVATCTRPDGEPQTLAWGSAELTPAMQASDLLASADLALMTRKHRRERAGRFRREMPDSESSQDPEAT